MAAMATILGFGAAVVFLLVTIFATSGIAIVVQRHNYQGKTDDDKLPLWLQSTLCLVAASVSAGITGFVAALVVGFTHKRQTFIAVGAIALFAGITSTVAMGLWRWRMAEIKLHQDFDAAQTQDATLACIIIAMICGFLAAALAFAGLFFASSKEVYAYPELGYYHRRTSDDYRNGVPNT